MSGGSVSGVGQGNGNPYPDRQVGKSSSEFQREVPSQVRRSQQPRFERSESAMTRLTALTNNAAKTEHREERKASNLMQLSQQKADNLLTKSLDPSSSARPSGRHPSDFPSGDNGNRRMFSDKSDLRKMVGHQSIEENNPRNARPRDFRPW